MAYTGYLVNVYMDANPYSETYGQERTERVLDTENCPVQKPANYVEVYTYCEMTQNGAYTGNCVRIFEDVEPMSATYGQQMEEVYTDGVLCPPDSSEADWQQINQYCEQIAYQPSGKLGNSGYQITVFQDMGSFSPTYQQTRETRTEDLVHCPLPDTSDVWVIISETCHLVDGLKDGTKDVVRVNTNEYSPNYNDGASETINVEDLVMCPLDPESPIWTETSYVCVLDEGYRTGYVTVTEEDTNPQSASYGQTRTRTYQDEERCPYQEKPQPVSLKWRVINNRGASTDTITSITLHFNSNFDIDILGSIAPAGGMLQGTVLLPASLTSTGLVCASIELSPNTSSPTIFQFSQTPNPFVWDNTSGSAVLTVTLWDGDGTGPEWTEISYTCETVDGYRTGAAIVVEEDMNPNSATYGEQRTRTIENDTRCPAQTDGDWVETSWSCQQESGYNTGYRISVQTDQNPNSSTYGSTRTRLIYDTTNCPLDTTAAWTEISYVCEQQDGFNTGNTIITERDVNPGSATYNTTRTRTVSNDPRCVRDTDANWVIESYSCETDDAIWTEVSRTCETDTYGDNTGNAIVVLEDTNPNSPSYGQTETTTVQDLTNCPTSAPGNYKLRYTTLNDSGVISCDQNSTLTDAETENIRSGFTSAKIGTCVDTIGEKALYDCDDLTTVVIANTVTTIGKQAFANCESLPSISLPSGLTSIGQTAFSMCTSLTSLTLPNTISSIGVDAFSNCDNLTSINIPTSLTTLNDALFWNDFRLASITIPNNITSIGWGTFYNCQALTTVTIPDSVTAIGESAFEYCTGLTSITLSANITSLATYIFKNCTSLTSITIPSGVASIRIESFYNCDGLTTVTIPASVSYIDNRAFYSCENLQSITVLRETPYYIGNDVFFNTNNCPIYVPANSVQAYKSHSRWSQYASRIQAIPNS